MNLARNTGKSTVFLDTGKQSIRTRKLKKKTIICNNILKIKYEQNKPLKKYKTSTRKLKILLREILKDLNHGF